MKIIHLVLGKANPDRLNGVNKVVHQLATAQEEGGMDVEIWGITRETSTPVIERSLRTRLFKARRFPFAFDKSVVRALLRETEPVMVHFHGGFISEFAGIAFSLRRHGIPYCLTAHGSYNTIAMEKSKWKKRFYFILAEAGLIRGAHAVHCIGDSEIVALRDRLPQAPAVLIPNGHHTPPQAGNENSLGDFGLLRFGFCGRLRSHTKGLDIMLDAFERFSRESEAELLIIGDGEDREALQAMAGRLGIQDKVRFVGAMYGEEKNDLLKKLDIFLHPSRNEGMPGAVLEAAGFGVPVIVSEATNLAPAIREAQAGIALDQNDPTSLADAMLNAVVAREKGDLARWAENAKNMVTTKFSWARIALLHQQMYQA